MFADCLTDIVDPAVDHGGGPAGPYQHVVDLVPCHKDVGSEYWKPILVGRYELYQTVVVSTPQTQCKLTQDVPCCHIHGTGSFLTVPCDDQYVSYGNTIDCTLKIIIK